jgi:hypothetical protein
MSRIIIAATLAFAALFPAVSGHAQNGTLTRSFVSSSGVDTNPCTITQPCATFAQAYTKVGANGIVAALDPGKYGPINITGPVTINGNGWAAITGPANGSGITITAGSGNVILTGLEIDGAGAADNGIVFADGETLEIADCVIRNFTQSGIVVGVGSIVNVLISNTRVLDNPADGIALEPGQVGPSAGGHIYFSFDHLTVNNNGYGIYMNALANTAMIGTITNSVINSNLNGGISLNADVGALDNSLAIKDSSVSGSHSGLGISVSFASLFLSHSFVAGNSTGIALSNSANVYSAGDNDLFGNFTPISGGSLQSNPKQ